MSSDGWSSGDDDAPQQLMGRGARCEQQHQQHRQSVVALKQSASASAAAASLQVEQRPSLPSILQQRHCRGMLCQPAAFAPQLAIPVPNQLLPRLAALRLRCAPFLLPQPGRCLQQGYLAAQLLAALRGASADCFTTRTAVVPGGAASGRLYGCSSSSNGSGDACTNDQDKDQGRYYNAHPCNRLVPDASITTPDASPGALQALLGAAAAAAGDAAELRHAAATLSGSQATPCMRALGAALQQQLQLLGAQLAVSQGKATGHGAGPCGALLSAWATARPATRRLTLLRRTLQRTLGAAQRAASPAAASSAVLDQLYDAACRATAVASGPQGAADAAALLHLLLSACVPLTRALQQWLWSAADGGGSDGSSSSGSSGGVGLEDDGSDSSSKTRPLPACAPDFFVQRRAELAATDARAWAAAYALCERGGDGRDATRPACPALLAPLACAVLTAGKGLRLLEAMERQQLRERGLAAAAASSGGQDSGPSSTVAASGSPPGARMVYQDFKGSQEQAQALTTAAAGVSCLPAPRPPRRQWQRGENAGGSSSAAAGSMTRAVRIELAVAAAVAGQQQEQWLPHAFVDAANTLLCSAAPADVSCAPAAALQQQPGAVLMQRALEAAGCRMARPCGGAARSLPPGGLRRAIQDARDFAHVMSRNGSSSCTRGRAQTAATAAGDAVADVCVDTPIAQLSPTAADGGDNGARSCQGLGAPGSPFDADAADAELCTGVCARGSSSGADAEHGLLTWQSRTEVRLDAIGGRLQAMAAWQPQHRRSQYDPAAPAAAAAAADTDAGLLLPHAGGGGGARLAATVPLLSPGGGQPRGGAGGGPGLLGDSSSRWPAGLWPLRSCQPYAKARTGIKQGHLLPDNDATCGRDQGGDAPGLQQPAWLAAGSWPAHALSWLLTEPPHQLPVPVPQLLERVLLDPLRDQVRSLAAGADTHTQTHVHGEHVCCAPHACIWGPAPAAVERQWPSPLLAAVRPHTHTHTPFTSVRLFSPLPGQYHQLPPAVQPPGRVGPARTAEGPGWALPHWKPSSRQLV